MSLKKHYPNVATVRLHARCVQQAVLFLAELGVEISQVRFSRTAPPHIDVENCPGLSSLKGHKLSGRGENEHGPYIKKLTHIDGCTVEWREPIQ